MPALLELFEGAGSIGSLRGQGLGGGQPAQIHTLRRWCRSTGASAWRLGAQDLPEAAAKREVPGAAERQKTLAAQDGKFALCGCGLTLAPASWTTWCR